MTYDSSDEDGSRLVHLIGGVGSREKLTSFFFLF